MTSAGAAEFGGLGIWEAEYTQILVWKWVIRERVLDDLNLWTCHRVSVSTMPRQWTGKLAYPGMVDDNDIGKGHLGHEGLGAKNVEHDAIVAVVGGITERQGTFVIWRGSAGIPVVTSLAQRQRETRRREVALVLPFPLVGTGN